MQNKQPHQLHVRSFLEQHFTSSSWEFQLPPGHGHETYFAYSLDQRYFVKLGVQAPRYRAAASIGVIPPILAAGSLEDGTSIIVQPLIVGKKPSPHDYRIRFEQFAAAIHKVHHSPEIRATLPIVSTEACGVRGLQKLAHLQQKWERYKPQVPQVAGFVDESLAKLEHLLTHVQGIGLVASHNDLCNANWLLSADEPLYMIDLDSMGLDDPALDIGATLWWYYPPRLREKFLRQVGYEGDPEFERRIQVRMAMHCLDILLPREQSFDQFDPASFAASLTDFKAVLAGQDNPQGYD